MSTLYLITPIVILQYFEQDDPDLYVTKIRFIEENDVEDMDLTFQEEEYRDGRLDKVMHIIWIFYYDI